MGEELFGICSQMAILFFIIALGLVCKKIGLTNADLEKGLSNIVLSIALPSLIVGSILSAETLPSRAQIGFSFLYACIAYLIMIAMAYAFTKLLRVSPGQKGAYRFMMVFGNVGFLGYPVVSAIYGSDAIIYAAIFNLPFNFLCFTIGSWFIASDIQGADMQTITWRTFLNPCVVASLVAILLALLDIRGVPVLGDTFSTLGNMTVPVALLVIGSQLGDLSGKEFFGTARLWLAGAARLIIIPACVWLVISFLCTDTYIVGILLVTCAMPVANAGSMICQSYGGDYLTQSQGIFITTLCSMVTIPILVLILGA